MTNTERFVNLVYQINRPNAQLDKLLQKILNSDFYEAPATTRFYGSYEGGLVEHCLKVYENLEMLAQQSPKLANIPKDSIIIVSLFHDFYKMNFFEKDVRNKKQYSINGSKYDELGNFDWVSIKSYKVREDHFVYGSNQETSEFMIRQFIPLTLEESRAILNATKNIDDSPEVFAVMSESPLTAALHCADMMACYINE